jgi:hypothetical protein
MEFPQVSGEVIAVRHLIDEAREALKRKEPRVAATVYQHRIEPALDLFKDGLDPYESTAIVRAAELEADIKGQLSPDEREEFGFERPDPAKELLKLMEEEKAKARSSTGASGRSRLRSPTRIAR